MTADLFHCDTVREDTDLGQGDALACLQGFRKAGGVLGLHPDYPGFRAQVLDVGGHAGDQATTANRNEHGMDRLGELPQQLHGHSSLAGDGVRVVIGVDIGVAMLLDLFPGIGSRLVKGVPHQHHLGTVITHGIDLDLRRSPGHHDGGMDTQLGGRQRNALGMIARRSRDDPTRLLRVRELADLVVGPTQLEGEDRLQILALEEDVVAEAAGQIAGMGDRGLDRHIVDARIEDLTDVTVGHGEALSDRIASQCKKDQGTTSTRGALSLVT